MRRYYLPDTVIDVVNRNTKFETFSHHHKDTYIQEPVGKFRTSEKGKSRDMVI